MKRVTNIVDKLKVSLYWIIDHGNVLIECCHFCGSTHVKKLGSKDANDVYLASYQCLSCGAIADVRETWQQKSKE